jgi:hypothetical protein
MDLEREKMKFKFISHNVLYYIGMMTTILVTVLLGFAIYINGLVEPWITLLFMNFLGYLLLLYIYISE